MGFDHREILLSTILRAQNFISNEKIQILQTLGKNYPEIVTQEWSRSCKPGFFTKIQHFLSTSI